MFCPLFLVSQSRPPLPMPTNRLPQRLPALFQVKLKIYISQNGFLKNWAAKIKSRPRILLFVFFVASSRL
nr:MAG TPA: hypothetical protein [Caudoviricetes sp.]